MGPQSTPTYAHEDDWQLKESLYYRVYLFHFASKESSRFFDELRMKRQV